MKTEKALFPIVRMARLLKVSASSYYAWAQAQRRDADDTYQSPRVRSRRDLNRRVRRIWVDPRKTYGSPRIHAQLRREGVCVDRKTVAASMRRQGIQGISPRRFRPGTTLPGTRTHPIPDRRKRQRDTDEVNHIWVTDITYLRTRQGRVHLCGINDACSRKIISTAMDTTMTTDLVETALRRAKALRGQMPHVIVLHSDRGAQFTSQQMYRRCKKLKLDQSMGRTGVLGVPPAWSGSVRGSGIIR